MITNVKTVNPTCFYDKNGYIEILTENITGRLSISWHDLPINAKILANGRIVKNLGVGEYSCSVQDESVNDPKVLRIVLDQNKPPMIDFVVVDRPQCDSIGLFDITVFMQGGLPPYNLRIGDRNIRTMSEQYYFTNIKPGSYEVLLKDKNGCSYTYPKILDLVLDPIKANIQIEQPREYGSKSPRIEFDITGGQEPYRIRCKDLSTGKIISTQKNINHIAGAGSYNLHIVDSNGCEFSEDFEVIQPDPLTIKMTTTADLSYNQLYPAMPIHRINNLFAFPKNSPLSNLSIGDSITIVDKKTSKKTHMPIVYVNDSCDTITINNKNMCYFYVAGGLTLRDMDRVHTNNNYYVEYNDEKINVSLVPKSNKVNFLVGSLILSNNVSYAFNPYDNIRVIYQDNKEINVVIDMVHTEFGYYITSMSNTVIMFACGDNEKLLKILNTFNPEAGDDIFIQSLDTKRSNHLGSVSLQIQNGNPRIQRKNTGIKKYYKCKIYDEQKDLKFDGEINYIDKIDNLPKGRYKMYIEDGSTQNSIKLVNQTVIDSDFIDFEIVDQETERMQLSSLYPVKKTTVQLQTNKYNYDKSSCCLSVYANPPDSLINIVGPNNFQFSAPGHQYLQELEAGVYKITYSKKGHKTLTKTVQLSPEKLNSLSVTLPKDK